MKTNGMKSGVTRDVDIALAESSGMFYEDEVGRKDYKDFIPEPYLSDISDNII